MEPRTRPESDVPETVADSDRPRGPATEPRNTIGRYTVLELLGRGGMGIVERAYDPRLEREVALKRLRVGFGDTQERRRLLREAQALAQLNHPNIVTVFDAGESGGEVYIAMEFIEGEHLGQWLSDDRRPTDILRVFSDAGRGLAAAHRAGIVHRDVKPGNIMLGRDGVVRILDFGLAFSESGPAPPPRHRTTPSRKT